MYVINIDDKQNKETGWVSLFIDKLVIHIFKKREVFAKFKGNTSATDLDKWNHCLERIDTLNIYFVSYMLSPYILGLNLKNKKAKKDLHGFIETVNKPKRQRNKLWFTRKSFITLCQNDLTKWFDILMYSAHFESESEVPKRL